MSKDHERGARNDVNSVAFTPALINREVPESSLQLSEGSSSPFFTLKEAAEWSRYGERQLRRHLAEGKLTRYGYGRKILILKAELIELVSPSSPLEVVP